MSDRWYERIVAAHMQVTDAVSHGERLKSDRYFVWQEDGSNDLEANNEHIERALSGSTDLYTKTELDPWGEALGESMSSRGIAWELVLIEFEPESGFWHWSWDWEVLV